MSTPTPEEHYASRFAAFLDAVADEDPEWLRALRREALEHFRELGFPTTKHEEWRYTSLRALLAHDFELDGEALAIDRDQLEDLCFPVYACNLFVFVNGRYDERLSSPLALSGGARAESLARLRRDDPDSLRELLGQAIDTKLHAFAALGTAFLDDGAVVRVPKNTRVEQPIHLVFVSTEGAAARVSHPRVLIAAEAGAELVVVQDHVSVGNSPRFTNAITEIAVGDNARVDWVQLQRECESSFAVSHGAARVGRDARFHSHSVSLGAALVRNDLRAELGAEGAEASLRGLFVATGEQLVDNHTLVDHALPHGTSEELYKGILADRSRGVFRGRVVVRPDAQKSDARQSNPNLLLDDGAEIDTKPQLEIYADDVKCSHGSTVGQIDPDALFYLRSRGIDPAAARELLTRGFAAEITEALPALSLGERIQELLVERLSQKGKPA